MRILVCGGRNFADRILLDRVLDKLLKPGDTLVHGVVTPVTTDRQP